MFKGHLMMQVIFIDVRNTARSRMAEAWLKHLARGMARADSCGTMPASHADPVTSKVMREVGVHAPARAPQPVRQSLLTRADLVIVLGKELDDRAFAPFQVWDLPDPADQPIEAYRQVRDEIQAFVQQLVVQIEAMNERQPQPVSPATWRRAPYSGTGQ